MEVNIDSERPVIIVGSNGICGMGNTMVRWYPDVWSAERNHVVLTVSAEGTTIHTRYLEQIPVTWLAKAREIHRLLQDNPVADLRRMATHKHSVALNGPLVAVDNG